MNIISHSQTVSTSTRPHSQNRAEGLMQAAAQILSLLERGKAVAIADLRQIMTEAFGGSDAEGSWLWKDAYEATEVAQVLFLRKFGAAIVARAHAPQSALAMLKKVARLVPTHSRRSEDSQALQQLSTPMPLAYAASRAAGTIPDDIVLEPSAGTGLLAIFAELAHARLALNEYAVLRRSNFGIDQTTVIAPEHAWAALADGSSIMALAGDMTLRRVRVMNEYRVELTGFTDGMRDWLKSVGLFSEMISWKLRFFVPVTGEGPGILSKLMQRHRLIDIARRS